MPPHKPGPPDKPTPPRRAPPKLSVVAPDEQGQTILVDAGASRPGSGLAPTNAPIAAAINGSPSVMQWRVWKDIEGARTYIGVLASHAEPEVLIARFPSAMPLPGQVALFILKGVAPTGKETGTEQAFRINGDAPDVHKARATLNAAPAAASPAVGMEAFVTKLREEHERQINALAVERRELADSRVTLEKERASAIKAESDAAVARIREEARIQREADADRRKADREEMESRAKIDREERERREKSEHTERERKDKLDREDRERKDKLEREAREAERDRDREHRAEMAKLGAKNSIEGIITTVATVAASLGIKPKEIVDKVLGGEDDSKSTAAVVGETISDGMREFGETLRLWMKMKSGDTSEDPAPRRQEPRRERRQIEDRPAAGEPTNTPVSPAAPASGAAPTTPTRNAALDAMPVAIQRRARTAFRELVGEIEAAPKEQHQALALAAAARTPALLQYVKAVGVKAACIEAGLSAEAAEKVSAAVPASALA